MGSASRVPEDRVRVLRDVPARAQGAYVLHWMIAARRTRWSFALDRAVELARELGKPLVVLEPLRVDYPWASDRLHRFVLEGMEANERDLALRPVLYHPYVEPRPGAGKGLLARLARDACAVVTDDWPCSFVPRMLARAAEVVAVRLEAVDSNGLLPVRSAGRVFSRAFDFRRFLQRELAPHLARPPRADPLARRQLPRLRSLPRDVTRRWPRARPALLRGEAQELARLPIDHGVAPADVSGGSAAGTRALRRFLDERLGRYGEERNEPAARATSELSPYLHFGHVSVHQVLAELAEREEWSPEAVARNARGARAGWWGTSASAEAFLDQLVTWRELGFNFAAHHDDVYAYETLPEWARATLEAHAGDPRPALYDATDLERARTHDELWNAAQNQLRGEGVIPGYLRMLWGKKILHWSRSPREALATMVRLNDRFALDGRDPNSASGIGWVLGRYDRPWGPERPVFGKVRYMSSRNTRRKLHVDAYLRRWSGAAREGIDPG